MTNNKWILLILFVAGLLILLIPDDGKPLVALNKSHGPSWLDLIGLFLMMISWVSSCIVVANRWKGVKLKTGNSLFWLLIVVYIMAIIGIVVGVIISSEFILWFCVVAASFINILFIFYAFNKR